MGKPFDFSVLRLVSAIAEPDYYWPWKTQQAISVSGSAFAVSKHQIVTTAHNVTNSEKLLLRRADGACTESIEIETICIDSDLALLRIEDEPFCRDLEPIQIADRAPDEGTALLASADITGSMARACNIAGLALRSYSWSNRVLYAVSISGDVEDGTSGGALIHDGKAVGIVMQGPVPGDSDSSAVPVEFLVSLLSGKRCDVRLPDLGVQWQRLSAPSLREFLGVESNLGGVIVSHVIHGGSSEGVLERNDVIVAIEGLGIGEDECVPFEGRRRHFSHVVALKSVADELNLRVVRSGREQTVAVTLRPYVSLVPLRRHQPPRYYVYAGVVFAALTTDYLSTWKWDELPSTYKYLYYFGVPTQERLEVVLITRILQNEATRGFERTHGAIVRSINGQAVRALDDVPMLIAASSSRFLTIEVSNPVPRTEPPRDDVTFGDLIVIDTGLARRVHDQVLHTNEIVRDRRL